MSTRRGRSPFAYYTVYREANDTIAAFGTAAECAKTLGMTRNTFYSTVTRCVAGKCKKWAVVVDMDQYDDGMEEFA